MIQIAPKAVTASQAPKVKAQKQEEPSKDTFLTLLSKKLGEEDSSLESKESTSEEAILPVTETTTPLSAVQELIAQLVQAPNMLVAQAISQADETVSQAIPITIVPVAQQVVAQPIQLIKPVVVEKQAPIITQATIPNEMIAQPLQQEQRVMQQVVAEIVPQTEVATAQQATPMLETKPQNLISKTPVTVEQSPKMTETVVIPVVSTESSSDVSTQTTNTKQQPIVVEGKPFEKPKEVQQNPMDFVVISKPTTQIENPMIVKISDEATKLEPSTQTQIVDQVVMHVNDNKSEFTMQLNPEHLGKVSVKLVSENGVLTVELHAENPKTQSLLLSSTNEIKELVQGATHNTTQVVASNQNHGMQQNYTQQESKQEKQPQQQQHKQEFTQNEEASTLDFISIMQELQAKSKYMQRV
ncbi:flagellar hook-length control protein FliK [Paludicola sp. MB14-C6]|uniref:flagellar hook-length control protein FliK n=1 Tax=Paludihabitans sp. MB14-C6 TaxID=3070656 RepID=UPI0027DC8E08|nr:flagellar hook-length control protein FliK [Paludicola sp. MB14-C6]WMJ24246.1 flagellar hook-length control protein FliK [Paludicola sp. MB14-C6]